MFDKKITRRFFLTISTLAPFALGWTKTSAYAANKESKSDHFKYAADSDKGIGVTKIVLLGTGTPNANPDRHGPSVAIVVNKTPYIIDCGPGVVRRAAGAYRKGVKGLRVDRLKKVFVTHLHSDHTAGYPDLILTPAVLGRRGPLEVYGPPGIKSMTNHVLKAYDEDIKTRTHGLEKGNSEAYKVNVNEMEEGTIYKDKLVSVKAFRVNHGNWKHAFGFRFETPDKVIVISGDTCPIGKIIEESKDADVLIHEVYCSEAYSRRTPERKKYHSASHTSTYELAKIALEARPKQLILYHQLLWGSKDSTLMSEIRKYYDGKVSYGNDLDIY